MLLKQMKLTVLCLSFPGLAAAMPSSEPPSTSVSFHCQNDLFDLNVEEGLFSLGGYGLAKMRNAIPEGSLGLRSKLRASECLATDTSLNCQFLLREFESEEVNGPGAVLVSELAVKAHGEQVWLFLRTLEGEDSIVINDCQRIPNQDNSKASVRPLLSCGLSGSVIERLEECLALNGDQATFPDGGGQWSLISYDGLSHAIWKDQVSDLMWTEPLSGTFQNGSRYNPCRRIPADISAGIELKFRVPSQNEFEAAWVNGARLVLSEAEDVYWTSTMSGDIRAISFNGKTAKPSIASVESYLPMRCVAYDL